MRGGFDGGAIVWSVWGRDLVWGRRMYADWLAPRELPSR